MAHKIVTKKTLILTTSESNGEFIYNSGKNDVYIKTATILPMENRDWLFSK